MIQKENKDPYSNQMSPTISFDTTDVSSISSQSRDFLTKAPLFDHKYTLRGGSMLEIAS